MWRKILIFGLILSGCNSLYYKTNTLDKRATIYIDRGGYQMQHYIKKHLEKCGYDITVGHKKTTGKTGYITSVGDEVFLPLNADVGRARYVIQVGEAKPLFRPIWCAFNGFWWLRFNISIADNTTNKEILGWSGHGCVNSSLRKLDSILSKMEIKNSKTATKDSE